MKIKSGYLKLAGGFTLVEVIMSLVLLSISVVFMGMILVNVVTGFTKAKTNAIVVQKGQIASLRMIKEFTYINRASVAAASATSITYTYYYPTPATSVTHKISWSGVAGDPLVLDSDTTDGLAGQTLIDNVQSFVLSYYDTYNGASNATWNGSRRQIKFSLTVTGASSTTSLFSAKITPRNS